MLGRLTKFASTLSLIGACIAGFCIAAIAGFILLEIILRGVFSSSTYMMDEMVGYMVAASMFMGLGYTFDRKEMIRVSLLISALEDKLTARYIVELISIVGTLLVTGFLAYYVYVNMMRQLARGYSSGTMSGMPQWVPTSLVLCGLLIFLVQVAVYGLNVLLTRTVPAEDPLIEMNDHK